MIFHTREVVGLSFSKFKKGVLISFSKEYSKMWVFIGGHCGGHCGGDCGGDRRGLSGTVGATVGTMATP